VKAVSIMSLDSGPVVTRVWLVENEDAELIAAQLRGLEVESLETIAPSDAARAAAAQLEPHLALLEGP